MSQKELDNSDLDQKITKLVETMQDLREELRIAQQEIDDQCTREIISNFPRIMITRAN